MKSLHFQNKLGLTAARHGGPHENGKSRVRCVTHEFMLIKMTRSLNNGLYAYL